jgi:hypothetical protein
MGRLAWGAALGVGWAALAHAQTVPFQLLVTQGNNAVLLQGGATLDFVGAIGQGQTATVTATYTGSGQVTIASQPQVFGSTAFTANISATLPITLTSGGSFTFNLAFMPTNATETSSQLVLPYTEAITTGTGSNATTTVNFGSIELGLQGEAPSFVLSYVLQTNQNVVPLPQGAAVVFPPTQVNTTALAGLNITNQGSGPGNITAISLTSGTAFQLTGVPLFPLTVNAGQTLQVGIQYTPTAVNSDMGQIQITFGSGSGGPAVTVALQGSGISAALSYQILTNPPVTVAVGGTIALPATNVGQTSSLAIQISNAGNASGTVNSLSVTGQGFSLQTPVVLPQTLAPGASLTFTIAFTPAQPGNLTGTLIINSAIFTLTGQGSGPQLTFSYVLGGSTIVLNQSNPSVIFSPVMITQSSQLTFDVENTGTLPAIVSNVGIGQANIPFAISGLPALPLSLSPNQDFQFAITFTPIALGFSNGTLQVNSTTVPLVGSGTAPPPLPSYTISGPSGTASPSSQPSIGLSLASPYPVEIAGTLTIANSGNLPADPAVQFATGGLTASFTIPANTTAAVFGNQDTQIGMQTGTVASTITLTPSFETQAGQVNLTPNAPAILQFNIPAEAPVLVAVEPVSETSDSLSVAVTGFSTTRTLTGLNIQFSPEAGFNLAGSQVNVNVSQLAAQWFQTSASQSFGSQFTITVPFTFQGTLSNGQSLVSAIASVSATASNAQGTSSPLQTNLP